MPDTAVTHLSNSIEKISSDNLPLALYWLGRHKLSANNLESQQHGMLDLLRVSAVYGDSQPELAGAALLLVMQQLAESKDVRGSIALRGELLAKYSSTYAAKQINRQSTSKPQPDP